jgi:peptide/nickel transport system substrate-binding protein
MSNRTSTTITRTALARALSASLLAGLGVAPLALATTPADSLVLGKPSDPQTLDPAITIDNNDWTVTYPCYQRLMRYKVEGGKGSTSVEGDLAESWKVSKDNLVWDFKLMKGQKFDDGTPVDAEAVKFSFDRMMKLGQGPSEAFPTDMKVSVVDPMSVRFTLTKVFAPFLYTLANNGAGIVNPKVLKMADAGEDAKTYLARNTAGSGAYRLASWQKGQSLVLEPNPYYGGKKPAFKQFTVKIIGESSNRRLQLESGDLDIAEALPLDQLSTLATKPGIRVQEFPSLDVTYLYLNNKKSPLNNPDVRRAISYAVDYSGIIGGVLKGQAKQMRGPIPEGMWGFDASAMQYKTDMAKAKALLAKAGAANLKLSFLYSVRDPNWEPIGLSTQANLATLGISVKMESMANATMRDRIGKGDYDISIGNWSPDFADPFMFMNYWFDSEKQGLPGNRSFYSNPEVDKLIRDSASLSDQKQRTKLYQQAQKTVIDEAAYVYLFQKNYMIATRDSVKGFVYNPMLQSIFNIDAMTKK